MIAVALAATASAQTALPFGVFRNRGLSPDQPRMQYLGAQWTNRLVRPLEFGWWADADSMVRLQCDTGMQQVLTLTAAVDTFLDAHFPADLPAWADSVSRVVERYDGDGFMDVPNLACPNHYWHVEAEDTFWDDSIDQYLTYLAVTRAAILSADPTAKVICMGLSSSQTWNAAYYTGYVRLFPPTQGLVYSLVQSWMSRSQRLLSEGAFDIVDLHLYETNNVIAGKLAWVRSLLPEDKEIWALESGAGMLTRAQGYSDTLSAQLTLQLYAECLANGMTRVADGYLSPSPGNFDNTEQFANASLTRWNPYPVVQTKPAYETYSLMTEKLAGYTVARDMSDRSGADERSYLYDMRFQTPRGTVDIVWTPTGTRAITLPIAGQNAKVTHVVTRANQTKDQAQVYYYAVTNGTVTITVNNDPIFVEASGALSSGVSDPGASPSGTQLALSVARTATDITVRCEGASGGVSLDISDVRGARVRSVSGRAGSDGVARLTWNMQAADGRPVAPGVYFVAARDADNRRGTSRVMVLR